MEKILKELSSMDLSGRMEATTEEKSQAAKFLGRFGGKKYRTMQESIERCKIRYKRYTGSDFSWRIYQGSDDLSKGKRFLRERAK